jgi:hypothetical protein
MRHNNNDQLFLSNKSRHALYEKIKCVQVDTKERDSKWELILFKKLP